jgi:hypothetical protein
VIAGARRTCVEERFPDGTFRIRLKSQPVDGKANRELISLLARAFGTAKSCVRIISGAGDRWKLLSIEEPSRTPEWFRCRSG